jgi:hypothetical protein
MTYFHDFLMRVRCNRRLNIVFANMMIWLNVVFAQIFIHKFSDGAIKKLLALEYPIDWKIIVFLIVSALLSYFLMTKTNQNNNEDKTSSQAMLENEMASIAMNVGGALLLNAGIIFMTTLSSNSSEAVIYALAGFSFYSLAYFVLSTDKN